MEIEKIIKMINEGKIEEAKDELKILNMLLMKAVENFKKLSEKRKNEYKIGGELTDYSTHLAYLTCSEYLENVLEGSED